MEYHRDHTQGLHCSNIWFASHFTVYYKSVLNFILTIQALSDVIFLLSPHNSIVNTLTPHTAQTKDFLYHQPSALGYLTVCPTVKFLVDVHHSARDHPTFKRLFCGRLAPLCHSVFASCYCKTHKTK